MGWPAEDADARRRVSSWVRETAPNKVLDEDLLVRVAQTVKTPTFLERADRLFREMARRADDWMQVWGVEGPGWEGVSWSNGTGLQLLLQYLVKRGVIEPRQEGAAYAVTAEGLIYLDELNHRAGVGDQGFVAMWFSEEVADLWTVALEPGIRTAGYHPVRIDLAEYEGRVDDEIIAQIRRSRFVVADLTGHRGGVYYEAGFAEGLGLPVYLTCREDEMEKVHFDVNHYRFSTWKPDALEEFAETIRKRVEADIGRGPRGEEGPKNPDGESKANEPDPS